MREVYTTELLVSEDARGASRFWQGLVLTRHGTSFYTKAKYWHGEDGKTCYSGMKNVQGKNIGRKNETTPRDQAILEIERLATKKRDKGYRPAKGGDTDGVHEEDQSLMLPMLAKVYKARMVKYPCYVQPKLDGVRCLFDGERAWSRQGKEWLPEIVEHLKAITGFQRSDVILDGELMLPKETYSFQQTLSAITDPTEGTLAELEYHIYDCCDPDYLPAQFRHRSAWMRSGVVPMASHKARFVPTYRIGDQEQLYDMHGVFVAEGYEGTIIRDPEGVYKPKHRSSSLLKLKDFIDEEFTITGSEEAEGKDAGTIVFRCISNVTDRQFAVRPRGTHAYRRRMWQDRDNMVGKVLTVRYQNLTDDGVPRFAVGIAVRDYE